ncbi:hypothetical protein HAX54_042191, partial [Datura stramonium]|nr:hypothetical protein [Datura stramonium]
MVEVQGFRPLPRPTFHRLFAGQDWRNTGVVSDEFYLPNLLYSTDDSSISRGSAPSPVLRRY